MGHVARASFPAVRARERAPSKAQHAREPMDSRRTNGALTARAVWPYKNITASANSAPLIHTGPLFFIFDIYTRRLLIYQTLYSPTKQHAAL